MSILSVQDIAKRYKFREVVKGISIEIRSGEVVGLLGPNGAGKTTIFYMITGLIAAPTAGGSRSTVIGRDAPCRCTAGRASASATCRRKRQSSAALTVEGKTSAPILENRGRSRPCAAANEESLEAVAGRTSTSPTCATSSSVSALSGGGRRRRCEIARALASQSGLHVLLDEPFTGVDPDRGAATSSGLVRHLDQIWDIRVS